MGEFLFALIALGIFVAWGFIIAVWFRQPFSGSRAVNITFAVFAFVLISIVFHALGVTGRDILDVIKLPLIWVFERLDRLLAWIAGFGSWTVPVDFSDIVNNIWEASTGFLVDAASLASGAGDANGFVANLGLVIFYLVFRSLGAGMITFVMWFGGKVFNLASDTEEDLDLGEKQTQKRQFEKEGHSWWFDNISVKRSVLMVYRVSVGFLGACILAMLYAAAANDLNTLPDLPEWAERLVSIAMTLYWAGPIILAGEIAAAVKVAGWFDIWWEALVTRKKVQVTHKLDQLFETYKKEFYDSSWLDPFSFEPDNSADGMDQAATWTDKDSEDLLREFNSDSLSRLKEGILTSRDFSMMADLIQITKDNGGTTLVICPQSQNQDHRSHVNQYDDISTLVRDNIKHAMGNTVFDVTQTPYMLRDSNMARDLDYSILIGSEFEMADVLSRSAEDSAYEALIKVRSIILVEFQRLDTGVLALQLQRLRREALNKRFAVICQSDARRGLDSTLKNLFQDGAVGAFNSSRVLGKRNHSRYWLLWRFHKGLMKKLGAYSGLTDNNRELPLQESLPLLILPSWHEKRRVSIYDPLGRILLRDWHAAWLDSIQSHGNRHIKPLLKWLNAAAPFGLFRTRELSQIIFQEDHANIHEVIQRYNYFEFSDDTMVHIVSSWYPMRDFMYSDLKSSKDEKVDINTAKQFLPIQPMPANGPKQVAISIYDALRHHGTVTEDHIQRIMLDMSQEPAPRLLKEMGATSAKRGIQMLFSRVLGLDEDLETHTPSGTRQARFGFSSNKLPQDFYLAKVVWRSADTVRTIARVYAGDYGLSYTIDTFLPVGRNMFRVNKVESIKVPIEADTEISVDDADYGRQGFIARPTVKFCRNYRLINEHERMAGTQFGEEVKDYPAILIESGASSYPGPGNASARLVHMSFERETFGRYTYEHNVPFGLSNKKDCQAVQHPDRPVQGEGFKITRVHQPVLVLSFVSESAPKRSGDRGKIAFTLGATLNDVVATLFPRDAHRVALVSPQVSLAQAKLRNPNTLGAQSRDALEISSFAELSYPQYIAPDQKPGGLQPGPDWSRAFGDVFKDGRYRLADPAKVPEEDTTYTSRRIDILALEDAGLDLGVARAIYENWGMIKPLWLEYLRWLSKKRGEDNPYAFGGKKVPESFDFEGALEWLK